MAEPKITEAKPTDLLLDSNNANRGTQRGQKLIQDSLREDGVGRGIVIDANNNVVAGNKTLENAVDIGIDKAIIIETTGKELVVTKRIDWDLYEDESPRRYAWRDNHSALKSINYDPEILLAEIERGIDFDGIFEVDEIKEILGELGKEEPKEDGGGLGEPGAAEKAQAIWQVKEGDIWQLGRHRIACGDCTDRGIVERLMDGKQADACITDPPYGQNFNVDYTRFSGGLSQSSDFGTGIINDDKTFDPSHLLHFPVIILWGANYCADKLPIGSWLVWDKRYKGQEKILSDGEIGWVNKGIGVYIFTHGWNGFLRESERGKTLHPTQKPIALFAWCIENWAKDCNIIFDPYCGSGPVFSACEQLNRHCYGVEIDPSYMAICLQRANDAGITPIELIK